MTFPVPQKVIFPSQFGEFQFAKAVRGGLCQLASEMHSCPLSQFTDEAQTALFKDPARTAL